MEPSLENSVDWEEESKLERFVSRNYLVDSRLRGNDRKKNKKKSLPGGQGLKVVEKRTLVMLWFSRRVASTSQAGKPLGWAWWRSWWCKRCRAANCHGWYQQKFWVQGWIALAWSLRQPFEEAWVVAEERVADGIYGQYCRGNADGNQDNIPFCPRFTYLLRLAVCCARHVDHP